MKLPLVLIALLFSLWACSPPVPPSASAEHRIPWLSLAQAKPEALASNKPMLIDFFTGKDCPRCQLLVREVYSNPTIADRIMRDFIPVRVDLDQPLSAEEKALAARLENGDECILAFLTATGSIIADSEGKRICSMDMLSPESFTKYLDAAVKNIAP